MDSHDGASIICQALPNDPELVDILAKNGVDISVSEGDQQEGNYASLLGNLAFPLIAFAGLFFLFRRAQSGDGSGGGGAGYPMKSVKSMWKSLPPPPSPPPPPPPVSFSHSSSSSTSCSTSFSASFSTSASASASSSWN